MIKTERRERVESLPDNIESPISIEQALTRAPRDLGPEAQVLELFLAVA